jgi:hypothetical protein
VLAVVPCPDCADVLDEGVEPCAAAVELSRPEPPVLLPVAGAAPMALEPLAGAPIAVLPGVVGPDMLLLGAVPALDPGLELPLGPELPMLPLLPGVVVLLATAGSQGGIAPGAAPVVELEV